MLTDTFIRNAPVPSDRAKRYSDGESLFFTITPKGLKTFVFLYRFAGKQTAITLGTYPRMTLGEARARMRKARQHLAEGRNPAVEFAGGDTFEKVAKEWFELQQSKWKTSYSGRLWSRIETNVIPVLGAKGVDNIEPMDLLEVLRTIEERGSLSVARRVRALCSQIFKYAMLKGLASRDPSNDLVGLLKPLAPVKHRTAMTAAELPRFLHKLHRMELSTPRVWALKLTVLTFARTHEIRFAEWKEFEDLDGEAPLWRVPAARMKQKREHLVPLAPQAVRLLKGLKAQAFPTGLLFPSTGQKPISENAMLYLMYEMGYHGKATVHGLRGTASTILNESTRFDPEWIELQLSHDDEDKIRAAYNSAKFLKQRREMMVWWADYLDARRAEGAAKNAEIDEILS